ncbi:hypothetical protein [Sporosarcina psychrophila]|uniref:Uncharacterized protein n=1 Tax=Sporosarcina psychrophila TaxID=1476 RepID=A0ABV2KF44_SPOPS
MVRFKDLNFGLGMFLHTIESEEEFTDYKYIIKSLKPDVVIDDIKEGYFSKIPDELKNDGLVKKAYYEKLEKLNMIRIKKRDIANDSMFDYQGKDVSIDLNHPDWFGSYHLKGKVVSVEFDEQKREFRLLLEFNKQSGRGRGVGGRDGKVRGFRRYSIYESDIDSIVVED